MVDGQLYMLQAVKLKTFENFMGGNVSLDNGKKVNCIPGSTTDALSFNDTILQPGLPTKLPGYLFPLIWCPSVKLAQETLHVAEYHVHKAVRIPAILVTGGAAEAAATIT